MLWTQFSGVVIAQWEQSASVSGYTYLENIDVYVRNSKYSSIRPEAQQGLH